MDQVDSRDTSLFTPVSVTCLQNVPLTTRVQMFLRPTSPLTRYTLVGDAPGPISVSITNDMWSNVTQTT